MPDEELVRVYLANPKDLGGPVACTSLADVMEYLANADVDETWEVQVVEMPRAKLDAMPEHRGW